MGKYLGICTISLLALLTLSCGGQKKQVEADLQEELDYRTGLNQYKIGVNYMNNGELIPAITHLEKSVELDTGNYRYRHALGLALSLNGQLEEAVDQLQQSLAINPSASESQNLLGTIFVDLERYDEAVAAFRSVIRDKSYQQPEFAYLNLAKAMVKQGRLEEAKAAYTRAVTLKPNFYRAYVALGDIHKQDKDFSRALFYYQKAEPGFADSAELLFEIGNAYFQLREFDRAKAYLAQVSILFPEPSIDEPTQAMLRFIEKKQREARR